MLSDSLHSSLGIDVHYKNCGTKDLLSYPPVDKRPTGVTRQVKVATQMARPLHRRKKKRHGGLKTSLELEIDRARKLPAPGQYNDHGYGKKLNLFGKFPPHGDGGRVTVADIELREKANMPGPWDYMIPSTLKTSGGANLNTCRLKSDLDVKLIDAANSPGPGEYTPGGYKRSIPGFVFRPNEKVGKGMFDGIEEGRPGPGEYPYDPGQAINQACPVKMCASNRPRPTFTDDVERVARQVPGVGAYDLRASDPSQFKHCPVPVISNGKKPFSDLDWKLKQARESPAPGQYHNMPSSLSTQGGIFPKTDLDFDENASEDSYEW